jgi:multiple sugar transport system ATP-binding protein
VATVAFDHVNKTYRSRRGDVPAVRDLCLDVADRALVVLVGPSGCGKTTTLRLLAGLEGLDSGTIRIGDRAVEDLSPKDRDVAMVFQSYALYPHMTARGNMAFPLKMRRLPKAEIERKVKAAAELLGISHLLDRRPRALSGGECQRVALGRAIVRNPQVFLFDEPLSNLDAKLRVHMRTELRTLVRRLKTTTLYVTHDQEEAMTLGDRLVVLRDGVVQQCGEPVEVYDQPANRFVASFFGTPAMNFLEGRLNGSRDAPVFEGAGTSLPLPTRRFGHLAKDAGRAVTLGIRPEHLGLAEHEPRFREPGGTRGERAVETSANAMLRMTVSVVEPLGDSQNVHLVGAQRTSLIARLAPTATPRPGEQVDVVLDLERAYAFSSDDAGTRLV